MTARSERGSAVAEFTMVSALLVVLVVAIMQLMLALHVRNTLIDAAAEGARYAALADANLDAGITRTRDLVTHAVGPGYANNVTASYTEWNGTPAVAVTVVAAVPLMGLLGLERSLQVTGHAAREVLP